MKLAFIVYDGMTPLDFAGMYDPLTRIKTMGFSEALEYDVCAHTGTVRSFEGLKVQPDRVGGGTPVLGAAGFLKGKRATTHPALMEYLKRFTHGDAKDRRRAKGYRRRWITRRVPVCLNAKDHSNLWYTVMLYCPRSASIKSVRMHGSGLGGGEQ